MRSDQSGKILIHYRKIQIVANVETYFLSVGDRGFGPVANWAPPVRGTVLPTTKPISVGLLICNDIVHPEPADILTGMGVQLILVPTANAAPTLDDNMVAMKYIPVRSNENGVTIVYVNYAQTQPNPNIGALFTFYGGSSIGQGPTPSGLQNTPVLGAGLFHIPNVYVPPANELEPHCPASGRDRYPQWYTPLADATECVAPPAPPPCPPSGGDGMGSDHISVRLAIGLSLGLGIPMCLIAYLCGRRSIMVDQRQNEHYTQLSRGLTGN